MLNVHTLPKHVLNDLRDSIEENGGVLDTGQKDKIIGQMTSEAAFAAWLHWNGIIGYDKLIVSALDGIRTAEAVEAIKFEQSD